MLVVLLANWPAHLWPDLFGNDPWHVVLAAFTIVVLFGFLFEMAVFRPPAQDAETPLPLSSPKLGRDKGEGGVVVRLSLLVWMTAYLGLLPSFLVQLRWIDTSALALGIFVPKCCDIGAYFTGRLLGRHRWRRRSVPKRHGRD